MAYSFFVGVIALLAFLYQPIHSALMLQQLGLALLEVLFRVSKQAFRPIQFLLSTLALKRNTVVISAEGSVIGGQLFDLPSQRFHIGVVH